MIKIVFMLAICYLVVVGSNHLWAARMVKGEHARKVVHIFMYSFLAFWPLFLSWQQIKIIIVLGLLFALVIRVFGWFQGMFDVKRKTQGDVLGGITALAIAWLEPSAVLFATVMLHIGLADGLAAIIGTHFGKSNTYKVFGYKKSIAGSLTFFVVSLGIMTGLVALGLANQVSPIAILVIPLVATLVENIGLYGADNALIAIAVTLQLNLFGLVV